MNYVKKVSKLVLLLGLLLLASCSQTPTPQINTESEFERLATVNISATDTEASLEAKYGGKAIVFRPEAGFAILGFTKTQNTLTALTTDPNATVSSPEVSIAGTSAWGGGKSAWGGGLSAWGGGKSAWGGGKSAWGGGYLSLPVLPTQNRAAFVQMRLPQAHALSKNFGYGIKVAVIDSGIDTAHPAFAGSLAPSTEWKDFVDGDTNPQEVSGGNGYGHGTGVAGIILQVAPKATILPIRVLDTNGMGDSDKVIAAIDWAVQKGAKVINLSLGTNEPVAALKTMVSYANQMGVFVITSAGNSGSTSMTYPAANANDGSYSDRLISVGSVNNSGSRSSFSNYGTALKFTAPGEQIYSAYPANQSAHMTGTSFAAPIITGAITLALADNASSTWSSVQSYMVVSSGGSTGSLFGTLDVAKFLQWFPGSPRRQALFVVWDPSLPDNSDVLIKKRLESMGYVVTVKDDSASLSSTELTGKDIVLISESVGDTNVNSKYRNVTVPVITWENGIYDDMLMISSSSYQGDASGQSQTNIVSSSHPMAAGLSGTQTVYNSSYYMAWGTPSASAVKIATLTGNANNATIFGYEKDASMAGLIAPARRAGFFFSDYSANNYANSTTWKLFEAAVTWTLTGN